MASIKVSGMHCEGCENRIQKVIGKIESVTDVKADRNEETVAFNFDGTSETMNAIKSKIDELGYRVDH
ncbi:MAG: heavy-metal-associated domain-containing protein [Balneolaceae bacterium]|jgi:copper chaperone CopZ